MDTLSNWLLMTSLDLSPLTRETTFCSRWLTQRPPCEFVQNGECSNLNGTSAPHLLLLPKVEGPLGKKGRKDCESQKLWVIAREKNVFWTQQGSYSYELTAAVLGCIRTRGRSSLTKSHCGKRARAWVSCLADKVLTIDCCWEKES